MGLIRNLGDRIRRAAHVARAGDRADVRVSAPTNVVASVNEDASGSVRHVSSRQRVRVRDGETVEERTVVRESPAAGDDRSGT